MAKASSLPKWSTPERRAELIELWGLYGNKCLFGHPVCSDVSHYIRVEAKSVWSSKPVYLPYRDTAGNPIEGKYLTLYKAVKVAELKACYKRLYDVKAEEFIGDWIQADKEQRQAERKAELRAIHSLGEKHSPLRGQFSAISREIWGANQPLLYIESYGISGLTLTPFAKVRVSSSFVRLYVDLGDSLRTASKNQRRKAIRYGKPLPMSVEENVASIVRHAVKHYLDH